MGKDTGFLEYNRELPNKKSPQERVKDYKEFYLEFDAEKLNNQAARCMDCGTPFCHNSCPLGNVIPDFNDMVYHNNWEKAYEILSSTNNFPEFTGRICPAPCEASCVLSLEEAPTTIELIEKSIVENAFKNGFVKANPPLYRTGKRVAIVGSGPSGLAAASQLNQAGHWVVVFERDDRIGGLLRYGIPDFKLEKDIIDRRVKIMKEEGIAFKANAHVGENITVDFLMNDFDAVLLCGGSTVARKIEVSGGDLKGVTPAMDFLKQQNKRNAGDTIPKEEEISATGKHVVVIGGGDTGSDCVGTSNRQGAKSITQIELLPKPPVGRTANNPWPQWANVLRTSTSHEEGCKNFWSINTKEFIGDENGKLTAMRIMDIKWNTPEPGQRPTFVEIEGTEREIPCDLAFLAVGFLHPQHEGLLQQLNIELDDRDNVKTEEYRTNIDKVFAAGDMRKGQSLVVWAISEGREAAIEIDKFLMGQTSLESKNKSVLIN